MKLFIAVLCLVGTTSLQQKDDYLVYHFTEIERYWTISPRNKVLFTRNQSEPSQDIELKEVVDAEHELLVYAEVTHTDTGNKLYVGDYLKICVKDNWGGGSWDLFAVRFFKVAMMPQDGWHRCPIKPQRYKIVRWIESWIVDLPEKLSNGHYEISYIVKSASGELVFAPLKFRFVSTDITPEPRCC